MHYRGKSDNVSVFAQRALSCLHGTGVRLRYNESNPPGGARPAPASVRARTRAARRGLNTCGGVTVSDFHASCECERENEPSCADWLGGQSDTPTHHVCHKVRRASVEWFAWKRFPFAVPEQCWLASEYPLPLGAGAVAAWNERERALANKSRREWEAYQEAGGWQRALADNLAKTGRAVYWEPTVLTARELPAWFTPVVAQPDAWLGLAGRRTTDAGTAWLLGLAELASVSDDLRSAEWKQTEPVVLIEACARARADLDALTAAVRPLLDWYRLGVLGQRITVPVGRPAGSKEYWQGKDDYVAAVRTAIRALLAKGKTVTQEHVYEYIAGQMTRVAHSHAQSGYSLRQFQRDRADYGFSSWAELRDFCMN